MLKIGLFAFAITYMADIELTPGKAIGFIFMLGFTNDQVGLMIAAYIAIDSFGTACNVTGDGAIALVVNKLAKGQISRAELVDVQSSRDDIIEE